MIHDRKKICLASIHTSDMEPLAQLTWHKNKKLYCDLKGYSSELKEQNTLLLGAGHCFRDHVIGVCPELNRLEKQDRARSRLSRKSTTILAAGSTL